MGRPARMGTCSSTRKACRQTLKLPPIISFIPWIAAALLCTRQRAGFRGALQGQPGPLWASTKHVQWPMKDHKLVARQSTHCRCAAAARRRHCRRPLPRTCASPLLVRTACLPSSGCHPKDKRSGRGAGAPAAAAGGQPEPGTTRCACRQPASAVLQHVPSALWRSIPIRLAALDD